MRTLIFLSLFTLCKSMTFSQAMLNMDGTKVFIQLGEAMDDPVLKRLGVFGDILISKEEFVAVKQPASEVFLDRIIDVSWVTMALYEGIYLEDILREVNEVHFASYFLSREEGKDSEGVTGLFYLKSYRTDETYLAYLESTYKIDVVDLIGYQSSIIKILLDRTCPTDVFELERQLEKEPATIWTQVGYLSQVQYQCTGDPLFYQQWGLRNTGQNDGTAGVDIGFCAAHAITSGSPDITIAIIDSGVEMNHPDLDISEQFVPDGIMGTPPFNAHGTRCAGIAGANVNNIGGTGVAPDCQMVSGITALGPGVQIIEWLAESIEWAWENGADVLSCSWSCNVNNNLSDAITNALTLGRDGLGCIVVFSSGNETVENEGIVNYPADLDTDILAVGAIDRCGIRSGRADAIDDGCDPWCEDCREGSQFGPELDVVAPGTNVFTTDLVGEGDINNDYSNFEGTSAAAPFVAGLAALILSINPCLTVQEVNTIIESSCSKVGGYNYQVEAGRPNGSWNEEVGYGLINAGAALHLTANSLFQDKVETGVLLVNTIGNIRAGEEVDPSKQIGPYTIASGANVEFKATESIVLESGFVAANGSEFWAHIEDFTGDCIAWNSLENATVSSKSVTELLPSSTNQMKQDFPVIEEAKTRFELFPNPYSDVLYAKLHTSQEAVVTLQFFDALGRELSRQVFYATIGEEVRRIDTGENNGGLFFVRYCINGDCETQKVIRHAH